MAIEKKKSKKKATRKKTPKKSEKTKSEEVCATFEIEKDGKEKTIETCGHEDVKIASYDQIKHENKLLQGILLTLGIIILGFAIVLMFSYSTSHFESGGVKYNILNEKGVTFYHTVFPSNFISPGKTIDDNVYLRTDPRELKSIAFDGNLNLLEMAVISNESDFDCEGDGAIAVANFNQIMKAMGVTVTRDSAYSKCDTEGRYMFFNLVSGNETKIVQTGPACYDFEIKDCEILPATEKFIAESLSAIQ